MAKQKKFGTFGGVFTPSILTILGVIMYLRFPSIIGQAGLYTTLGIILVAHIISITTSLSVASLSTDKPVQNGGTYFMISRSLGLPIGGTLGYALFVGLSFSVSLYLIGFAESFLQYFSLDSSINSIRLTGTIILLIVTTVTFISTSLAIKSQYFIMAAIGLSLLSILFGNHDFQATTPNLLPSDGAMPFMLLFGIFFPAVTGFEAGVSMSGDLENPRKSLPVGAIMAVAVGFLVYIGLAFFFAYTVDGDTLKNDSQVLFKIALVPQLVIAGIWGATLSSALGSILGAPRILQAIAMDKIAPKFLAKGTGSTNEPRNALLVAFVIAEAGILIGELDVIARIVSMFFITTYAFLNLASAIESWSSSDFRPAFRIPRFVSILGAFSAFIVMILLDFLALSAASVVLGLLFLYLRRKELLLESGDAWSSFWTNLAKRSLLNLANQKTQIRNWRPNIISFKGSDMQREHLSQLGLTISGKLGILTEFNLLENNQKQVQTIPNQTKKGKTEQRFFKRSFNCSTIEEGIDSVTSIYGFSGFEPNTVLMGWSHNNKNADFLANVLKKLNQKNLNTVFLDYDQEHGFGKKQNIDIWWNGKGRHLSFALNLLKFILSDADWRDAKVRIFVVIDDSTLYQKIHFRLQNLLSEKRIIAKIEIIKRNNRNIEAIVHTESEEADLIILGLSPENKAYQQAYIQKINTISELPVSLLLLSSSDEFEEINLLTSLPQADNQQIKATDLTVENIALPKTLDTNAQEQFISIDNNLQTALNQFGKQGVSIPYKHFSQNLQQFINTLGKFQTLVSKTESSKLAIKDIQNEYQTLQQKLIQYVEIQHTEAIRSASESLQLSVGELITQLNSLVDSLPKKIKVHLNDTKKTTKIKLKSELKQLIEHQIYPSVKDFFLRFQSDTQILLTQTHQAILQLDDKIGLQLLNDSPNLAEATEQMEQFIQNLVSQQTNFEKQIQQTLQLLLAVARTNINKVASGNYTKQKKHTKTAVDKDFVINFQSMVQEWEKGFMLFNNSIVHDAVVCSNQLIIRKMWNKNIEKMVQVIDNTAHENHKLLLKQLLIVEKNNTEEIKPISLHMPENLSTIAEENYHRITDKINDLPNEIELPNHIHENDLLLAPSLLDPVLAHVNHISKYYFDSLCFDPFFRKIENLEKQIEQLYNKQQETSNVLFFKLKNKTSEQNRKESSEADNILFINQLKTEIENEFNILSKSISELKNSSNLFIEHWFSKLSYPEILQNEDTITNFIRIQKSEKIILRIRKFSNSLYTKFNTFIVDLIGSGSKGIILSKQYLLNQKQTRTQIGEIREYVQKITPPQDIIAKIPVLYRLLFNSGAQITSDYWIDRPGELNKIKIAFQLHSEGAGGAILVRGANGSGKSTILQHTESSRQNSYAFFHIQPPIGGSTSVSDFEQALKNATQHNAYNAEHLIEQLEHNTVLVIDTLELWWEQQPDGYEVIKLLMKLIEKYSKKVVFLLAIHEKAYQIIRKTVDFDDVLLRNIQTEAFGISELKQLILKRHKSSGLEFEYKNRKEENISQLKLTLLFNTIFNISEGIPGVALNTWLANIETVVNKEIKIVKPSKINTDLLHKIEPDWLVVCALFIRHNQMNKLKISRLYNTTEQIAENYIIKLENAGLIQASDAQNYIINPFVEPLLTAICVEKGIL